MLAADLAAYKQLQKIYRAGHNGIEGVIVAAGGHGTQYAATRLHLHGIQRRAWRASIGTWTSWRRIRPSEVIRLATLADEAHYRPDFGRAWEAKP